MQNNSQNINQDQNGGYKIPAVPQTQPAIQPQPVKKVPQPVAEKQNNNNPKKIPQLPQMPQQQPGQQVVNAPKNKSRSRSRSSSRSSSSKSRSSNRSSNKDGKSKKSKLRSTRKPKYQNEHHHIIAKLFGKNNVNQKALFDLLEKLQ